MVCCYFPTTVAAIDDDADFLKILQSHLALPHCLLFTSPEIAIDALSNQIPFERMKTRLVNSFVNHTTSELFTHNINIKHLHEEIYNPTRYQDISVIIVDYYMGEFNGIDLCQKLFHHPAKKILLTGGIDKEKIAIEAFNKGIIHRFINKSDINFPSQLKQTIAILKEAYFRDLTHTILPNISEAIKILENPTYITFIRNLQEQLNAEEFYLLDTSGSMIFRDIYGKFTYLIVKGESELNDYEKIASDSDDAPFLFVDEIKARKKIPFFFSEEDYQQPVRNWGNYLHPALLFPGIEDTYYALIDTNQLEFIN